jgi:hypothetical protein
MEITYDINEVKKRLGEINRKLRLVKQAIDRANLNNYVDVPDYLLTL